MASNIHAINASPCCKSGESFDRRGMTGLCWSKTCQNISGSMDVGLTRHRNDYLKETKQQIASASPFTSDKHIDCMSIMCTYMKLHGEIEAASQVLMPVDPSNLPVCAWWGLHCAPVTGGNASMYDCAGWRLMLATLLCARWCMWTTSRSKSPPACIVRAGSLDKATLAKLHSYARVQSTEGRGDARQRQL